MKDPFKELLWDCIRDLDLLTSFDFETGRFDLLRLAFLYAVAILYSSSSLIIISQFD